MPYNTRLENSYDRQVAEQWDRSAALIVRLLLRAGTGALEGDGRTAFAARILPILAPVTNATLVRTRAHSTRQLSLLGLVTAEPADLTPLALTEDDVFALLASAARYFFATGNKKDYTDPAIRTEAFRYAAELTGKAVVTALSARRTEASARLYGAAGVTMFERYLGSGDSCAKCKAIAGAVVTREDVRPIHDRCTCGVRPLPPRA